MRKLIKGQKGLSLVEVTIMLLVLMLLTSVLAPSMWDFIHDAQWVKVKEDCEAIGISVSRMVRDVGPCFKFDGSAAGCSVGNRVDVLYSLGNAISLGASNTTPAGIDPALMITQNWNGASNADSMEDQLVQNTPNYNTPFDNYPTSSATYPVGPLFGLGWRGAYLAPPIGPDPWGMQYLVNSGFLATVTSGASSLEGGQNKWWEYDVFCITGGPNQVFDTPYAGSTNRGTDRQFDDFVYVISGSGR